MMNLHIVRILAAYLLVLTALSNVAKAEQGPAILGATKTGILVWIAEDLGYFDDVPGGAEVRSYNSGTQTASALLRGEIDLATSSEFAFGSFAVANPTVRAIAAISASRTCLLFTRADSGIAQVADLRGRRVGVTQRSIGQYFLGQSLTLAGVGLEEVEFVNLGPSEIPEAIADGRIDAAITWEPFVYQAQLALEGDFRLLDDDPGRHFYFLLISQAPWLDANPDAADAIVRALKRAETYAAENPAEAQAIIQQRLDLSAAYVEHLWPRHTLRVSLPQDLLFVVEEGIRWRMDENLLDLEEMPDTLRLIDLGPLDRVSPADVGIIRW